MITARRLHPTSELSWCLRSYSVLALMLTPVFSSTAVVLDHFAESVNKTGGIRTKEGHRKEVRVALLAGAGS